MTVFRPLASLVDLEAALQASHDAPVVLFKHSQTCGASHMARGSLAGGEVPGVVYEVVVQQHRDVSDAIARRLGVRHESPQALVVADGAVVWHGSHAAVSARRLQAVWPQSAAVMTPPRG